MARAVAASRAPGSPKPSKPPTASNPAGAGPSRFLLGRAADLGLIAGAPAWILPLVYGLGALVSDQVVNNWVMALGAVVMSRLKFKARRTLVL